MLGISTCWWHKKGASPDRVIVEIKEFGLKGVELEYRLPEEFYLQLRNTLKNHIKVLSIHNFFPCPQGFEKGGGDLFLLSSPDAQERQRAVQYTIRSIRIAEELGAGAVVLHLGRVDMPHQREFLWLEETSGNLIVTEEMRRIREERYSKNLSAVLKSLDIINKEAIKRGVQIGIENRYYFHEIPDRRELAIILQEFGGGNIGYWHDMGHAHAQKEMGLFKDDMELLREFGRYLIGVHIHDAIRVDDHRSPGKGEIDFHRIREHIISDRIIKVLELHPWVKKKRVIEGIRFIESILKTH